jgi:uncharacterized protein YodC (DUF2158 family)
MKTAEEWVSEIENEAGCLFGTKIKAAYLQRIREIQADAIGAADTIKSQARALHYGTIMGGSICNPAMPVEALYVRDWEKVTCEECLKLRPKPEMGGTAKSPADLSPALAQWQREHPPQFKPSDVVMLKSGGPRMTVVGVRGAAVSTVWFGLAREKRLGDFRPYCLCHCPTPSSEAKAT